jgi:hypothetical protein
MSQSTQSSCEDEGCNLIRVVGIRLQDYTVSTQKATITLTFDRTSSAGCWNGRVIRWTSTGCQFRIRKSADGLCNWYWEAALIQACNVKERVKDEECFHSVVYSVCFQFY